MCHWYIWAELVHWAHAYAAHQVPVNAPQIAGLIMMANVAFQPWQPSCLCLLVVSQGAQTSIYLASSPDVDGISSKYYDSCRPVSSSPASYDTAAAARLWDVSQELTQAKAKATVTV